MAARRIRTLSPGFSTLELVLILLVVGLLVAGSLFSLNIIDVSRQQKTIRDLQQYRAATISFRLKYDYLPGDYPQADVRWGNETTRSGNGDAIIRAATEGGVAWQHLSLAKMLDNAYQLPAEGQPLIVGTHVPKTTLDGVGVRLYYHEVPVGGRIGNAVVIGSENGADKLPMGALKASKAHDMDRKADDGQPFSGWMMVTGDSGVAQCDPEARAQRCRLFTWID